MQERTITEEMMSLFRQHLIRKERCANTIKKYLRDVTAFRGYVGATVAITKEHVNDYREQVKEVYKIRSANSMLSSLNVFFDFAEWYELRVSQFRVQRQLFRCEEQDLSKEEYMRLLCAARKKENERLALLVETLCATGIRVSEHQYITVESLKKGVSEIDCKGKIRTIVIPQKLCRKLQAYARAKGIKTGAVFVTASGKPLNRSNIWRDMRKLCALANVCAQKVFPHNLRHLFAKTYYAQEKDIVKLADILGHAKVETTRIYTISSVADQVRRIERLGLVV